jgi:LAO/AO transport system kinase
MEIADVFCLNKSDRPGSERVKAELESILEVRQEVRHSARKAANQSGGDWHPPVVNTVATSGQGVDDLWAAIQKHREYRDTLDPAGHRRLRARSDLVLALEELARRRLEEELLESPGVEAAVEEIVTQRADPYTLARRLFDKWRPTS